MGYTPGVLALFYKVAIAPVSRAAGHLYGRRRAMIDFGLLLANPRTLLPARRRSSAFATVGR